MSDAKKTYRTYCFDGSQRTLRNDLVEAETDEQAIAMVEQGDFGTKCELWEGNRLVAQLEAERRQA